MSPPAAYHHATRSEIIELAAAEGHDADIPSNAGSIRPDISRTATKLKPTANDEKSAVALELDVEKGDTGASSTSIEDSLDDTEPDPNIVDFDGPDDPENPMNWGLTSKWGTVTLVSALTFLTPLASSMFAPGVPQIMKEFNSTSDMLASFMLSIYVLGFAVGPLVIAPLSEMYGRLPLYHICNVFFIVFTIAAAVSTNMGMFITFRFFMGCFGGAPMVLGGGTVADLISKEQRGTAMSIWLMGPTIGPAAGPVIGAFLTVAKGWRWNFWFVAIVAGGFFVMSLLLMRETSAPVILKRKANRLRKETGNDKLKSKLDSGLTPKELFQFSIFRPIKMLLFSEICLALSVYIAIVYGYLYILFTTFSSVFENQYGWHGGVVGLSFLGIGAGSLIGQILYVHYGNMTVQKHLERGDYKPEHRLYHMTVGGLLIPIGLFIYGWTVQAKTQFMGPLVATGVVGFGLLLTFMPASTYLVDVFGEYSASAMAASTVLRSIVAAFIPLSSQQMYKKLGYGWGNSLLGFVALLLVPIPFVLIKYGERIRARSTIKL